LDTNAYKDNAWIENKRMLGLVASMVLRCTIVLITIFCNRKCGEDDELYDAFNVALVVGGSI
jgi:hypothetical protein